MKERRWLGHVARMVNRRVYRGSWWRNMSERDNLENLELNGKVLLECFFKKRNGSLEWIDVAYCRYRCRVPLYDGMNHQFS